MGRKRRRVTIGGRLQTGISLRILGAVYVYIAVFALLVNLGAIRTVVFDDAGQAAYIRAVERLETFVEITVVPLALTFLAVCVHVYCFSRRFAGPIDRIRDVLKEVREGNLSATVRIRDEDYFHDLCEELNGVCRRLRADIGACRDLSTRLAEAGEALAAGGGLRQEEGRKLLEMANTTSRLRKLFDGYRLPPGASEDAGGIAGNALEERALPAK